MAWMKKMLVPPVFEDAENTRIARMLYTVLLTFIVLMLITAPLYVFQGGAVRRLALNGGFVLILFTTLLLTRRGYLRAASILFTGSLWSLLTLAAYTGHGVHAPAFSAYALVIVISGLLLGRPAVILFVALSLLSGVFLAVAETRGLLPTTFPVHTPFALTILYSFIFLVLAMVLELALQNIRESLTRANQEIQQRITTEQALRGSEARLNTILDFAPFGIYFADVAEGNTYVNARYTQMVNRPTEALLGMNFLNFIHPDDLDRVRAEVTYAVQHRSVLKGEFRFINLDGSVLWVRSIGNPVLVSDDLLGYVGTIEDITTSYLAQERLREIEERYRVLVRNFPNGGVFLFDRYLCYTLADGAGLEAAGLSKEAMEGKSIWEALPAATCRIIEPIYRAALAGETSSTEIPLGDALYSIHVLPIRNEDRQVICGMMMAQDITERKRLEEQFLQSQKIEGIGRLAGGIAHDFNNLLTAILGYTELAENQLAPEDPTQEFLEPIRKAAERAANLTGQLLAFASKQIIAPKVIDINELVLDMDKLLRRLIGEDVDLVTLPGAELGRIKIDPGQFEQILVNLAVNARDAMPGGGRLTIETNNVMLDADYAHIRSDMTPGDYVRLAVSDTGIGMDEAVQEHIFEPFFTTKEKGKGTGLGLATCHGIVKQNGGHIGLCSEPGKGTTFNIYLPRVQDDVAAPLVSPIYRSQRGTETILLAEDEPMVREMAVNALQAQGYTILEAGTGHDALALAEAYNGEIHLLLTDVVMPLMSGTQLAQNILPTRKNMKVLYVSGYTDDTILQHGVLEAEVAFLQKPYSPGVLTRKVREVLDREP